MNFSCRESLRGRDGWEKGGWDGVHPGAFDLPLMKAKNPSRLQGLDGDHAISGLSFDKLVIAGRN